jgi:uncharacterized heparinase superfamily protein
MVPSGRKILSTLYKRSGIRQVHQAANGGVFRFRQTFRKAPEKLLVAPTDLRASDPFIAEEIVSGRYTLAGRTLDAGTECVFDLDPPSPEFATRLHSFVWLRDFRATRSDRHFQRAQEIAQDWIARHRWPDDSAVWKPQTAALRLMSWLSHSPVILKSAQLGFYRRFLKSIGLHVDYLRSVAPTAADGLEIMRIRIALAMASLSLPSTLSTVQRAGANLDRELDRQILADGGHISRNPRVILDLLMELLPLRQTYVNLGYEMPSRLIPAIDRMFPALRFFRHQSGELSLFNGATATLATELVAVLRYDESAGQPFRAMPYMRYQRIGTSSTAIIVDTGYPISQETSTHAHAGCLSFELSSGGHRLIVNSGAPLYGPEDYRQLARTTAAHSTVTLNDTSSSSFGKLSGVGTVVTGGVRRVEASRRDDPQGEILVASHDGYLDRFGLYHERSLQLHSSGTIIRGGDRFMGKGGAEPAPDCGFRAVARFHIHPSIQIRPVDDHEVLLVAPDAQTWSFTCIDSRIEVGEDVFFADSSGIRGSRQLEIAFDVGQVPEIQWRLEQKGRLKAR